MPSIGSLPAANSWFRVLRFSSEHADQFNDRLQNLLKPIRDAIEQKTTTTFKPADILPRIVEIDKLIAESLTVVEQTTRDLLAIANPLARMLKPHPHVGQSWGCGCS